MSEVQDLATPDIFMVLLEHNGHSVRLQTTCRTLLEDVQRQLSLTNRFRLQFFDATFNRYVDLICVTEVLPNSVLRVIEDSSGDLNLSAPASPLSATASPLASSSFASSVPSPGHVSADSPELVASTPVSSRSQGFLPPGPVTKRKCWTVP